MKNIRNFSIMLTSTTAKARLLTVSFRSVALLATVRLSSQIMDTMDIEKERGITIKAQSVRLNYALNGQNFVLNLIDTPGHVDF